MKVLVTGATGFTGCHTVPLILQEGIEVHCLVRPTSDCARLPAGIHLIRGDLDTPESLEHALTGMDALVNIASLGFGHAPVIVRAAVRAGIRRALFISTTAIFTRLDARSKSVRLAAEELVRSSGLAYTILRPTMIYGGLRDRNMSRLIRYLKRWPVIPVFGGGKGLQQPVHVDDVARAITRSLTTAETAGRSYDIPGGTVLTFEEVIDTVCKLLDRVVFKVHLPNRPVAAVLGACEALSLPLPLKREQILRLEEDKVFDYAEARRDFGYQPRSFEDGICLEMREMGTG